MVLTVSFALSPVIGLCCHRRRRSFLRRLDASVEASGPHDFAVRKHAPSSEAPLASTASRPASVTIAIRPSVGRDGGINKAVSSKRRSEKFFDRGLDSQIPHSPSGKSVRRCKRSPSLRALAKQSMGQQGSKRGLLRRFAPLRKRFAFVAGNDDNVVPAHAGTHTPRPCVLA